MKVKKNTEYRESLGKRIKNFGKWKILKPIYVKLKSIFDPRKGPEMILRLQYKTGMMHADTSCLPTSFKGEKEDDPNTWVWMGEFGVFIEHLKDKKRSWISWVEDYFIYEYEKTRG